MAVAATDEKMIADMTMPPNERNEIDERFRSHRLGRATRTARVVRTWGVDSFGHIWRLI